MALLSESNSSKFAPMRFIEIIAGAFWALHPDGVRLADLFQGRHQHVGGHGQVREPAPARWVPKALG